MCTRRREREEQEQGHAQHEMREVGPGQTLQGPGIDRMQDDDALRPVRQDQHHRAVRMREGERQRGQAQTVSWTHRIARMAMSMRVSCWSRMRASNRRRCSSMREADEADDARDAAGGDGDHLLLLDSDEQRVEPCRRQQADGMSGHQEQYADMEEVRAPEQLPLCAGSGSNWRARNIARGRSG
jgi:hypothetical protein